MCWTREKVWLRCILANAELILSSFCHINKFFGIRLVLLDSLRVQLRLYYKLKFLKYCRLVLAEEKCSLKGLIQ